MKNKLIKRIPPGYPFESIWNIYWVGYVVAIANSFAFLYNFVEARSYLYIHKGPAGKQIFEGAVMPDFCELIGISFYGFFILAALCMLFSYSFYSYFHKDSKSIYLMKRLPLKHELLLRCMTVPTTGALFSLASALILLLLYFAVYMLGTPDECLTPGQFEKLWGCVLC